MIIKLVGKCSWFGGPEDHGVKPDEGLALYQQCDISNHLHTSPGYKNPHNLFLYVQPKGTTGTARRLDPNEYYIACRWDYDLTPREFLRGNRVTVIAEKTNKSYHAWPADWGPNEDTGRVADLSYGLMIALGINTDDVVTVEIPEPTVKIGTD